MASASSHRSAEQPGGSSSGGGGGGGRKTARWFSLRRMIQDVQQQRISSRKRRSAPVELEQRSSGDGALGWYTPSTRPTVGNGADQDSTSAVGGTTTEDDQSGVSVAGATDDGDSTVLVDCTLCALSQPRANFARVTSTCSHRACRDCLRHYLTIEIMESRVNVECPACPERLHPNDIQRILQGSDSLGLIAKYEEFALRRLLVHDPDARWCPAPDCGYVVIATGCASCPKLSCERPGCGTLFCYHCKQTWHPNQTCDAARAERAANIRSSFTCSQDSSHNEIKPCPRCGAFIIKMDDGSCNHMTCAVCGAEFCWLCMKEISDLHYLSPSGCTFWGKKPWSRKKKLLWQLGTLIGAPVGISLMAAIAVPAIIIGVPIWVGRKLYAKCSAFPKHKRNLVVAGGVISTILLSPVLAALTVGIGVPILLAYVYGVVPISLCRSGGCGVSTTDNGGVKIDFDESDVPAGTSVNQFAAGADTRSVVETDGHRGINPSIGPSIGEMSVGMTNSLSASGSHLERVGVIREDCGSDRDSASHQAMAGSCINASLSGSLLAGPSGFHNNRLEVQAEVTSSTTQHQKRASLSSESANFSIDAKSVTVSFGDNVSIIALAGSICARDKDNSSAVVSMNEMSTDGPAQVPVATNVAAVAVTATSSATDDVVTSSVQTRASSFQRCGSPPATTRSVSFVCGDVRHSSETAAVPMCSIEQQPHVTLRSIYAARKAATNSIGSSIDESTEVTLPSLPPQQQPAPAVVRCHSVTTDDGQMVCPITTVDPVSLRGTAPSSSSRKVSSASSLTDVECCLKPASCGSQLVSAGPSDVSNTRSVHTTSDCCVVDLTCQLTDCTSPT